MVIRYGYEPVLWEEDGSHTFCTSQYYILLGFRVWPHYPRPGYFAVEWRE